MLMTQKVSNLIEVSGCRVTYLRGLIADTIQLRDICQQDIQQLRDDLKVARLEAKLAAKQHALVEIENDLRGLMDGEVKAAPLAS